MDEKCSAVAALGAYARHCGPAFRPFLEQAVTMTAAMADYFLGEVRAQAYLALGSLLTATHRAYPPQTPGSLPPSAPSSLC